MFCRKCGKEIAEGAAFCNSCGAKIERDVPQAVEQAAPIPVEVPKAEPAPTPVEKPKVEFTPVAPAEKPKAEPAPAPVEKPKVEPTPVAPVEKPKAEPTPVEQPKAEPPKVAPAPAPTEKPKMEPAPAEEPEPEAVPFPKDNWENRQEEPKKKQKKKKEKKKGGKLKFVLLGIVAVLLICGIVLACSLFPLKVTTEKPENVKTHTGIISELTVTVKSNQPIREVRYALDPEDEKNLQLYTVADTEGSLFEKKLTLTNLRITPGEAELELYVETWFGEYWDEVELECDIGTILAPKAEDIVSLSSTTGGTQLVVDKELIVGFLEGVTEKKAENIIKKHGGQVVGAIYPVNMYQVHFDDVSADDLDDKITEFKEEKDVKYAVYNSVYESSSIMAYPNDGEYDEWDVSAPSGNNWHMECIDAPGAWEYHSQFTSIGVGILDSTLYNNHEDLKVDSDRIHYLPTDDYPSLKAVNEAFTNHNCYYIGNSCPMCGMQYHGTHVSGIVGAIANNKKGVAGTNWNSILYFSNAWLTYDMDNGRLEEYCTLANMYHSITILAVDGCRVINMSLGDAEPSQPSEDEKLEGESFDALIAQLESAGYDFLIVKAAGNDGEDASMYSLNRIFTYGETAKKHVIIVGAVTHSGMDGVTATQYNPAYFTNYGELVEIFAPGMDIYSTMHDGYAFLSGTSMASPMVAGVASMVYGVNPALTSQEVKAILTENVNKYCARQERIYPVVNARLAVECALGQLDKNELVPMPQAGYITGMVQDAATLNILESAMVRVVNNETSQEQLATILDNGTYYLYAEAGTYTMYFSAPGYISETIYNVEVDTGIVKNNVLLNMVPQAGDAVQTGVASGYVVDAFDAHYIPGATIQVYRGIDNKTGEPIATVTADEGGHYTLELEPGNYTLRTAAEGYTSASANMIIIAGQHKDYQNCALTPILNEGEIRVVLTWGQYPSDLDSHMVGPYPDGFRFHVFYNSKNAYYDSQPYVNLDVDDTTSYGPETTSVYMGVPGGTYTFYVHDYSNRGSSFSNAMATSGAVVKVYVGGVEEPYVFNAPAKEGTLWTVFTITDGVLTPTNEMSYHTDPGTIGA